jgi:hypothetical protein
MDRPNATGLPNSWEVRCVTDLRRRPVIVCPVNDTFDLIDFTCPLPLGEEDQAVGPPAFLLLPLKPGYPSPDLITGGARNVG